MAQWGSVVSWLIVLVGWVVVNRQHNNRETRKEVRASLLDLYGHLDEIEDDAFEYHTQDGDPLLGRQLKRDIDQIYMRIRLSLRGPMTCSYAPQLAAFRQSVTLQNFDTANFVAKDPSDSFFDEIFRSKRALINRLETAYNNAYK